MNGLAMSDLAPKGGWRTVRFDDIASMVNDRIDNPEEAGVDRYVGLEHLDTDSLRIRRWGSPSDVTATKLRFRRGDIIFGRRRVYQRKLAVADFDGICSAHAMVLRAKPDVALPEFLPFFMQGDIFMERAKAISVGSLSPTINWKSLAEEKFALPPLDDQRRIAGVLRAAERHVDALVQLSSRVGDLYRSSTSELFADSSLVGVRPTEWAPSSWACYRMEELVVPEAPICYGIVQVGEFDPEGVPTLAISSLAGNAVDRVHRTNRSIERRYGRSRVIPGDVVVSIKGTVGLAGLVPEGFSGNISRDLARLRLDRSRMLPSLFPHLWASPRFQRYIKSLVVGTTRAELSIAAIRKLEVPTPPISLQYELLEQLLAVSAAGSAVASHLSACRDNLALMTNRLLIRGTG
jgi:hypothetical protein